MLPGTILVEIAGWIAGSLETTLSLKAVDGAATGAGIADAVSIGGPISRFSRSDAVAGDGIPLLIAATASLSGDVVRAGSGSGEETETEPERKGKAEEVDFLEFHGSGVSCGAPGGKTGVDRGQRIANQ